VAVSDLEKALALVVDLQKERKLLMDANAALVDSHAKLSVGYLALRLTNFEERVRSYFRETAKKDSASHAELAARVEILEKRMDKAGQKFKEITSEAKENDKS